MTYNTYMENLTPMKTTPSTYVSPRTGTEYQVVPKLNHRVVAFVDGQPVWDDQPTFEIVLNGNPVQFALSEEGIASSVAHFESAGPNLGSRFD